MSHDALQPHAHEPNPTPPTPDATLAVLLPNGAQQYYDPQTLATLPQALVDDCFIVSTGHGTSGPFRFGGVPLAALLAAALPTATPWQQAEIWSADGFGCHVTAAELAQPTTRPILLCLTIDGRLLSRAEGAVRLVVPDEAADALRQVKWVQRIVVR